MAFSIDKNYTLKIRKGTSGSVSVEEIPVSFEGFTARLTIKKNDSSDDATAPINKTATVISQTVLFQITESDTDVIEVCCDDDYASYKWGIKIEDGNGVVAENVVPSGFDRIPDCLIYPEIGGSN